MFDKRQLQECLNSFSQHSNSSLYPWHYLHDGGTLDVQLQVNAIIHGNEVGSLPAVIRIMQELETGHRSFAGRLSIFLGNPEAALQNKRFLESDLNRMFLPNTLNTHESNRAQQLMPILDECDLLLDLHQTILSSVQAFYIFPNSHQSILWARALGTCQAFVDATPSAAPPTTRCADEYVWQQGTPAITIELGQKGFFPEAERLAYHAITTAMTLIEQQQQGSSLEELSLQSPPLQRYKTLHREKYHSPEHQLRPGLVNFMPIQQGEELQAEGTPELIVPMDGLLLFPKYPYRENGILAEAKPKDIYRILQLT